MLYTKSFDNMLAYHCAPSLLGIKPANLISLPKVSYDVHQSIALFNTRAAAKGLKICILCECQRRVLALLYNIRLGLYTEQEKEEAFEIINLLGLGEQAYKRCDELSGGQKQRVGIARAIMQRPKLIMCDEPIASLDPNSAKIIMDHLRDINRRMNITCLVNLHQVDVAMKYSDRIIGVNGGKIVYDGSVEELSEKKIHKIYGSKKGELITDVGGVKS